MIQINNMKQGGDAASKGEQNDTRSVVVSVIGNLVHQIETQVPSSSLSPKIVGGIIGKNTTTPNASNVLGEVEIVPPLNKKPRKLVDTRGREDKLDSLFALE